MCEPPSLDVYVFLRNFAFFFLFLSVGSFFLFLVSVINPADICFVTVLECLVMSSIVYGLIRNNGRVGAAFLRRTQTRQSCLPGFLLKPAAFISRMSEWNHLRSARVYCQLQGLSLHCRLSVSVWSVESVEDLAIFCLLPKEKKNQHKGRPSCDRSQ